MQFYGSVVLYFICSIIPVPNLRGSISIVSWNIAPCLNIARSYMILHSLVVSSWRFCASLQQSSQFLANLEILRGFIKIARTVIFPHSPMVLYIVPTVLSFTNSISDIWF
jgi:hypothetical protein